MIQSLSEYILQSTGRKRIEHIEDNKTFLESARRSVISNL